MSDLIVYTYDGEERAGEALKAVAGLKQENVQKPLVTVEDAAVVVKDESGKVRVRQTLETAVKGGSVASGGLWGVLIGFLFGGPLFGALLGMGVAYLFGRKIDIGIDNAFIDRISNDLSPGDSALFLLVKDTPVDTVAGALAGHGGTLHHTSLSDEAADALVRAGDHEPIREAVALEQGQG